MKKMFEYIKSGIEMVLVTVVASSGATPRGAGAKMIVTEEGRILGTIGGGAVEYRASLMAKQVLDEKNSFGHAFSLTKDDIQNLGMICGGAVQVYFHYIPKDNVSYMEAARKALELFEKNEDFWMISNLTKSGVFGLYSKTAGFCSLEKAEWILPYLGRSPKVVKENEEEFFVEQVHFSERVFVFGGGHVAQELVPVLSHVGFRCVVMDDREEFANGALFPEAEEVKLIDFERISDFVEIGKEDYVCVMTRGHSYDTSVQAQILKTPASYIGVIGSASKKAAVYKKLYEMGFTETDTDRITSPIGLSIKAETPAEIAISIAGQMILHRAEKNNQS
jgi:xanthine dehydrogenase accessory factor